MLAASFLGLMSRQMAEGMVCSGAEEVADLHCCTGGPLTS
jgi:hypothetical protein